MAKGNGKKSKKKFIIFGILGVLLLVVLGLVLFGGDKEKVITVQTEKVSARTITQVVSATGKINPIEQVILRPEVSGEIVDLPVEEGDEVKKGQLLIRIKPDIYIAQRNRAQASLVNAQANLKVREATLAQVESEYQRVKGLFEKGLASDSQLEIAKANFLQNEGLYEAQKSTVVQTQESLKEAQENLERTAIKAPLTGTVSELNVENSERVLGSSFSVGTQLMTVADLTQIEARVEVDENDVVLISLGDTAKVEIDAFRDRKFLGLVTQIGNSAKTTGLGTQNEVVNFEVRIKLIEIDPGIRPGMSCDADIQTETKIDIISVPIQSVTARTIKPKPDSLSGKSDSLNTDEGKPEEITDMKPADNKPKEVVFIVDAGVSKMVEVSTGISDDTYIEIKSGLDTGSVVVSGPYRAISKELEEGSKVRTSDRGGKGPESENE